MKKYQIKQLHPNAVGLLHSLLANMIGHKDRRQEMRPPLELEDVPATMVLEARILESIYYYWDHDLEATRDAVLGRLKVFPQIEKRAEEGLDKIIARKTETGAVSFLSAEYATWLDQQRLIEVTHDNVKMVENPDTVVMADIVERMVRNINSLSLRGAQIPATSSAEMSNRLGEIQAHRYQRYKQGLHSLPTFPFKGMKELYPGLNQGDPILWTGETKRGKSTMAQFLAEHWYECGFYVVSVEMETSSAIYQMRRMARHMGLPTSVFGGWTLRDGTRLPPCCREAPEWKAVWDHWDAVWGEFEAGARGKLVHLNTPNAGHLDQLEVVLSRHNQIAEMQGMDMIVIVDYLQKAHWRDLHRDERVGLALAANRFKNMIQNLGCYAVIFAQEMVNWNGAEFERFPLGSYEAQRVFQAHFSLVRRKAGGTVGVVKGGEHLSNAMGLPRYWCRGESGEFDKVAAIKVIVANDGSPGEAEICFENNLYSIYDRDAEPREYQSFFSSDHVDRSRSA